MRPWALRLHVLSTAIVGVQLLVWTGTGLAFTCFDFAEVRGTNDRAPSRPVDLSSLHLGPREAARVASTSRGAAVQAVLLESVAGRATYRVSFVGGGEPVLVDGSDGKVFVIDADVAAQLATSAHRAATRSRGVERRRDDDRDVFAVRLDDPADTEVSVDAHTGEIAAWKNRAYRRFDALWSAHVLGYVDRRSPANWPLRVVALLAVLVSTSGAGLVGARLLKPRKEPRWPVTKLPPCASG